MNTNTVGTLILVTALVGCSFSNEPDPGATASDNGISNPADPSAQSGGQALKTGRRRLQMVDKEQPLETMTTVLLAESSDCRPVTVLSLICQMVELSLWAV